jgi:hypothetical protein
MSDFNDLEGRVDLREHSTKRQRLEENALNSRVSMAYLLRNDDCEDSDESDLPPIDFSWEDHVGRLGNTMFKRRYRLTENDFNDLCSHIWNDLSAMDSHRSRGRTAPSLAKL